MEAQSFFQFGNSPGTDSYTSWEPTRTQITPVPSSRAYISFSGVSACTVAVVFIVDTDPIEPDKDIAGLFAFHRQGSVEKELSKSPRDKMLMAYSDWLRSTRDYWDYNMRQKSRDESRYKLKCYWLGMNGFQQTLNKVLHSNYVTEDKVLHSAPLGIYGGDHKELKSYKVDVPNIIRIHLLKDTKGQILDDVFKVF